MTKPHDFMVSTHQNKFVTKGFVLSVFEPTFAGFQSEMYRLYTNSVTTSYNSLSIWFLIGKGTFPMLGNKNGNTLSDQLAVVTLNMPEIHWTYCSGS